MKRNQTAPAPQQPPIHADPPENPAELVKKIIAYEDSLNGSLIILGYGLLASHLGNFLSEKDSAALCLALDSFVFSANLLFRYGPPLSSKPRTFILTSSSLLASISLGVGMIAEEIKLSQIIMPVIENCGLDTLARYTLLLLAGVFLLRQFNILKGGPHQPYALASRPQ